MRWRQAVRPTISPAPWQQGKIGDTWWRCRASLPIRAVPRGTCCPRGLPRSPRWSIRVPPRSRSEEHTSELQSHHDLVCRLLLEKKKKKKKKQQTQQKKKKTK